jgi:cell division protein FtsL
MATDPRQQTDPQRKGATVTRVEWGVITSLLISALTSAFTFGIIYGQVQRNDTRITKLETGASEVVTRLGNVETQLARIDANVTFLAEQAREERARRK